MLKVLFLSHGFPPAQHSGVFRSEAFARYLPEFDISPVVLAGSDEWKVLEYDRRLVPSETGVGEVVHVPWFDNEGGALPRAMRLIERIPVGWTMVRNATRRALVQRLLPLATKLARTNHVRAIYATSPPWESLILGHHLARATGLPLVCDLRDPWSHFSFARYRHWVDFLLERSLERRVLNSAARVIANTPTARELLIRYVGVEPSRIVVIPNGYDEQEFADLEREPLPALVPGKFVIAYTGLLGSSSRQRAGWKHVLKRMMGLDFEPVASDPDTRSARWFLSGLAELLQRRPDLRTIVEAHFVGSFSPADHRCFGEFPYPECLRVLPPVSARESLAMSCRADLLLLLQIEMFLQETDFCTAVPGKLYNYLRSGTPILAPMQRNDASRLIEEFHAGVVVPPRDTRSIALAVEDAVEKWRQSASRERGPVEPDQLSRYERRNLTARLAELFFEVVDRNAANGRAGKQPRNPAKPSSLPHQHSLHA